MKTITTLALLLSIPLMAAPAPVTVAKFEKLSGEVQYRVKNGQWKAAKLGLGLVPDTELQTGPRGKVIIVFANGSELAINSMTHAYLDSYGTGKYGSNTVMSLRNGRVIAKIAGYKNADQRNYFRIRTPTMVAGVRGTIQEVSYSPDKGCEVKMHESASDIIDRHRAKSVVPQGGKTQVSGAETLPADKVARNDNTATLASPQVSTAGERELSFSTGDFNFSSNSADFSDLLNLFDKAAGDVFSGQAADQLILEKL